LSIERTTIPIHTKKFLLYERRSEKSYESTV
jgi:hypothetical protein